MKKFKLSDFTSYSKIIVGYHKDCMDGLGSAYVAEARFSGYRHLNVEYIPLDYNKKEDLFAAINSTNTLVFLLDFSLKADEYLRLYELIDYCVTIDHHATAYDTVAQLGESAFRDKLEFHLNSTMSGAMMSLLYFDKLPVYEKRPLEVNRMLIKYIQDRDLWNFNLSNSEEINAAIANITKPNDIESMKQVGLCEETYLINVGTTIVRERNAYINKRLKDAVHINFCGYEFTAINTTILESELGNALVREFNKPSISYQITKEGKLKCSLRTADHLTSVEEFARSYGGGGHRNAAGMTIELYNLPIILNSKFKVLP